MRGVKQSKKYKREGSTKVKIVSKRVKRSTDCKRDGSTKVKIISEMCQKKTSAKFVDKSDKN